MTTPTTITSIITTTTTTTITDVVVAPSLGGLLVGCMLLLIGRVPVAVTVPTVWGEVVVGWEMAVEMKHITWHYSTTQTCNVPKIRA